MRPLLAVFDVDGTLLRGDCLKLAARRSRGPLGQLVAALACLPWLIGWQLQLVSTRRLKQEAISAFQICAKFNQEKANEVVGSSWLMELRAQLRPVALERLRWHQSRGDRVLLCSASPRMLLQPLADWLGVELLCTELERVDDQWQPTLVGPNCKGPEKVRRLTEYLGPLEGLSIDAYGDSKGDRDLLQAATRPHYCSFANQPVPYPPFSLGPLMPVVALALLGYGLLGFWSQGDQLLPLLRNPWAKAQLKAQLKGCVKGLLPRKLANAGGDGLAALRQLLQPGLLLQATVIGALAWSLEGVSLWLLLRGMGIEAVGIGGATIAHTAAGLLGALTLLPGGLGSTEAGTVGLLALQGVGVAAATPATLLIRLMTLWFATALGAVILLEKQMARHTLQTLKSRASKISQQ